MTRRLGVRWKEPEHGIAEIADIDPDVLAEFSQRSIDVESRFDELMAFLKDNMVTKREFKRTLEDVREELKFEIERNGQKIEGIHNRLDVSDDRLQVLENKR